ncbi:uncharacterized protein isoform X4 [Rhodnius prolixus]|uniref:uncharacterized protein isoform X4 n=1 Tax=Rhodnius prolixus TaxID=13249 RepID=UPI003D188DD6
MHAQRDLSFGRKTSSENVILLLKLSDLMTAIKMDSVDVCLQNSYFKRRPDGAICSQELKS